MFFTFPVAIGEFTQHMHILKMPGGTWKTTTPGGVFPATWSFHAAAAKVGVVCN